MEEEVQVVEEAMEAPKTMETGAFELPESDFEDGRLGVMVCVYVCVYVCVCVCVCVFVCGVMGLNCCVVLLMLS